MPDELAVRIWQYASSTDPAENRAALADLRADGDGSGRRPDLWVAPEAFAEDFGEPGRSLAAAAEPIDGPFGSALTAAAARLDAPVIAGMFEQSPDPARPYNTLALAWPGQAATAGYRKIHLYDSFGQRESDLVMPGPLTPQVVELGGFQVGLLTCYDLRFPELARSLSAAGAEILVMSAAWVAGPGKVDQWQTLLRARAIENVAWVIAAAQPGPRYCGHSQVIAPNGEVVASLDGAPGLLDAVVDRASLEETRSRNPSLTNRRM